MAQATSARCDNAQSNGAFEFIVLSRLSPVSNRNRVCFMFSGGHSVGGMDCVFSRRRNTVPRVGFISKKRTFRVYKIYDHHRDTVISNPLALLEIGVFGLPYVTTTAPPKRERNVASASCCTVIFVQPLNVKCQRGSSKIDT